MEPMATDEIDSKRSRIKLYFSVFIVNLVFIAAGSAFAWTSPVLPKLLVTNTTKEFSTDLKINTDEASWIVSLLSFGNIFGPLTTGVLLNTIGRRWTTFVDALCLLCSWIILTQTFSIYMIYIGRFLMGISCGISFSGIPLYIAEISEDSIRGVLNNFMQISVSLSVLFTYCVGPYVSYNHLIIFCCIPCIMFLIVFPWLPESPYYHIYKKQNNKAYNTLQWLRGDMADTHIEKEMKLIQIEISKSKGSSYRDIFSQIGTRRALFICLGLLAFQQLTGISIAIMYAESIFKMTGTALSGSICAIITGSVMLTFGIFVPIIVSKFGYKTPLLISGSGMTIAHSLVGLYLMGYLNGFEITYTLNWIPVVFINGFVAFHVIGFSTVPWALMGELFTPDMKTLGSTISTSTCAAFTFGLSNLFPNILQLVGIDMVFFIFSFFSVLSILFVVYFVPNTCGMSMIEIQDLLNKSENKNNIIKE